MHTAKLGVTELRWASQLAQFDYEIKYRPGKENLNADSLSRQMHSSESAEQYIRPTICSTMIPVDMHKHVKPILVKVRTMNAVPTATDTFPTFKKEQLEEFQRSDPVISRFLHFWKKRHKSSNRKMRHESNKVRKLLRKWDKFIEKDNVLYCKSHYPCVGSVTQILLPEKLHSTVFEALHNDVGHQGFKRTLALIRKSSFWPGMIEDIQTWFSHCERCRMAKAPMPTVKPPIGNFLASRPNEVLATDFTLLDKASDGSENVLVMTDVFSKFTQAIPTKNQLATTVIKALVREWFTRFGIPRRIHSDQGRNFEGVLVRELV